MSSRTPEAINQNAEDGTPGWWSGELSHCPDTRFTSQRQHCVHGGPWPLTSALGVRPLGGALNLGHAERPKPAAVGTAASCMRKCHHWVGTQRFSPLGVDLRCCPHGVPSLWGEAGVGTVPANPWVCASL